MRKMSGKYKLSAELMRSRTVILVSVRCVVFLWLHTRQGPETSLNILLHAKTFTYLCCSYEVYIDLLQELIKSV